METLDLLLSLCFILMVYLLPWLKFHLHTNDSKTYFSMVYLSLEILIQIFRHLLSTFLIRFFRGSPKCILYRTNYDFKRKISKLSIPQIFRISEG